MHLPLHMSFYVSNIDDGVAFSHVYLFSFRGYSKIVYTMLGGASCDVGCMVC
jgi:hypothetical protein